MSHTSLTRITSPIHTSFLIPQPVFSWGGLKIGMCLLTVSVGAVLYSGVRLPTAIGWRDASFGILVPAIPFLFLGCRETVLCTDT